MPFDLEKLFLDVFAPQRGEVVTVMYDLPHGDIQDTEEWRARREMAESWRKTFAALSEKFGIAVNPTVTYSATGSHNSDLPEYGKMADKKVRLEEIIKSSTIIISMPQYSASAPLIALGKKFEKLRVASMPLATKSMEETGREGRWHRGKLFHRTYMLLRHIRSQNRLSGQRPAASWRKRIHLAVQKPALRRGLRLPE